MAESQQQEEWTPAVLSRLFDQECSPEEAIKRICAKHTAELTAERQRRERLNRNLELQTKLNERHYSLLLSALAAIEQMSSFCPDAVKNMARRATNDLSLLHERDAEQLNEVVRLLASIFLSNGKSLLGGSPPPMWTPRMIAIVAAGNIEKSNTESRKPLVDVLLFCKPFVNHWLKIKIDELTKQQGGK